MKKLFPVETTLQIVSFEKIVYHGKYELDQITELAITCDLQKFQLQVEAKKMTVQHLHDEGFLLHCEDLHKLCIERKEK